MEARKFLALENDHPPAGSREQGRRGTSGGAPTDDRYVVDIVRHSAIKVASLRQKQTLAVRQRFLEGRRSVLPIALVVAGIGDPGGLGVAKFSVSGISDPATTSIVRGKVAPAIVALQLLANRQVSGLRP